MQLRRITALGFAAALALAACGDDDDGVDVGNQTDSTEAPTTSEQDMSETEDGDMTDEEDMSETEDEGMSEDG